MAENMYIYLLKPGRPGMLEDGHTDEEMACIERHADYLDELAKKGEVLLAGHTDLDGDNTFGVVIFYAPDIAAAEAFMQADPAVAEGVLTARVQPFGIAYHSEQLTLE